MKLTIDKFKHYITQGREIEFSFNCSNYFISSNYTKENHFFMEVSKDGIWTEIFNGTIEDFFSFEFEGKYTCEKYFNLIDFKYIL